MTSAAERERHLTADDQRLIERYRAGVGLVDDALAGITEDEWDRRVGTEWSARMVVHHLADSETNSYLRARRLLAESNPSIQGYDEGQWAATPALGYEELPVAPSLSVFRAVREATSVLLDRVSAPDMERPGVHTESGPYSFRDWLRIYAEHAEEHAAQITRARRGIAADSEGE